MKFVSSEDARFLVNDWKLMAVSRVHKGDTSVRRKNIFRVHSVRTKELLTWKYYRAEREKWEWCTGCAIKIAFIYWSHRCDVTSVSFFSYSFSGERYRDIVLLLACLYIQIRSLLYCYRSFILDSIQISFGPVGMHLEKFIVTRKEFNVPLVSREEENIVGFQK